MIQSAEDALRELETGRSLLGPGWKEVVSFDEVEDIDEYEEEVEELYAVLDLGNVMDSKTLMTEGTYQLIGMDTSMPFIKIGDHVLKGEVRPLIGTEVVLGLIRNPSNPSQPSHPPLHSTSHRMSFRPVKLYDRTSSTATAAAAQSTDPPPQLKKPRNIRQAKKMGDPLAAAVASKGRTRMKKDSDEESEGEESGSQADELAEGAVKAKGNGKAKGGKGEGTRKGKATANPSGPFAQGPLVRDESVISGSGSVAGPDHPASEALGGEEAMEVDEETAAPDEAEVQGSALSAEVENTADPSHPGIPAAADGQDEGGTLPSLQELVQGLEREDTSIPESRDSSDQGEGVASERELRDALDQGRGDAKEQRDADAENQKQAESRDLQQSQDQAQPHSLPRQSLASPVVKVTDPLAVPLPIRSRSTVPLLPRGRGSRPRGRPPGHSMRSITLTSQDELDTIDFDELDKGVKIIIDPSLSRSNPFAFPTADPGASEPRAATATPPERLVLTKTQAGKVRAGMPLSGKGSRRPRRPKQEAEQGEGASGSAPTATATTVSRPTKSREKGERARLEPAGAVEAGYGATRSGSASGTGVGAEAGSIRAGGEGKGKGKGKADASEHAGGYRVRAGYAPESAGVPGGLYLADGATGPEMVAVSREGAAITGPSSKEGGDKGGEMDDRSVPARSGQAGVSEGSQRPDMAAETVESSRRGDATPGNGDDGNAVASDAQRIGGNEAMDVDEDEDEDEDQDEDDEIPWAEVQQYE